MSRTIRIAAVTLLVAAANHSIPAAMRVGCEVAGPTDYSSALHFKDAMRTSRTWRVIDTDSPWDYPHSHLGFTGYSTDAVSFRDDGYPVKIPYEGKKVLTLMLVSVPAQAYPFGEFTLLFEGKGEIWLGWDAGGKAPDSYVEGMRPSNHGHTVTGSGSTTKFTFSVNSADDFFGYFGGAGHSSGICLHIVRSEESDPIRNIRVIIPDDKGGTSYVDNYQVQPFNPTFLEDHRPFAFYRLMGWNQVNHSVATSWSKRARPGQCFAARGIVNEDGVAYETMIDLCNLMHRDLWLNLPHGVDNHDYMSKLATLVHERLDKNLKVYLEYSNEVWNPDYLEAHTYAQEKGEEMGFASDVARRKYTVHAAIKLFEAFEEVFGKDSPRLEKVISGWHINWGYNPPLLDALDDPQVNPNGTKATAFATAPYFGKNAVSPDVQTSLDMAEAHITSVANAAKENKEMADKAGLKLITYESGQHMLRAGTDVIIAANRDPRMYNIYKKYYGEMEKYFAEISQFSAVAGWGEHGCWGAKEYAGQPMEEAHKYRAVYDYAVAAGGFDPDEKRYWEDPAYVGTLQGHTLAPAISGGSPLRGYGVRAYTLDGRSLHVGRHGFSSVSRAPGLIVTRSQARGNTRMVRIRSLTR